MNIPHIKLSTNIDFSSLLRRSVEMTLHNLLNFQLLVLFTLLLFSCNPENKQTTPVPDKVSVEKDTFDFYPTSTTGQIVHHKYYALSYDEDYENAEWVAYSLSPKQLSKAQIKRPHFIRDPLVKTRSAYYKNYYPNGYEKGHLCPAADRRFSYEAFDETFYTSNVSPMDHYFNGGIWNNLEKQVRYWTKRYGKLYIVTGGILTKGLERIGREEVAVPDEFYKIVLDYRNPKHPRMIGFIIPHKKSDADLRSFVVPVDSIEKRTGIDFFPALPDKIENKLESEKHPNEWKFVHFKSWQR